MPRSISISLLLLVTSLAVAAPKLSADVPPSQANTDIAAREAAFSKLLSGATLEGSFTVTGQDGGKLTKDKYTLGDVKKLDGNNWLFPTRIQYTDKDFTLPLTLPIEWAGDTPVVIVDDVGMPGLGTFSARVLFFQKHYAGYWRHGERGGHLFGVIHPATDAASVETKAAAGD